LHRRISTKPGHELQPRLDTGVRGSQARIPDHHFRTSIQRSTLVIKGLTFMPTGAGRCPFDQQESEHLA